MSRTCVELWVEGVSAGFTAGPEFRATSLHTPALAPVSSDRCVLVRFARMSALAPPGLDLGVPLIALQRQVELICVWKTTD